MLWNSRCVYTQSALKGEKFSNILEKSMVIPALPLPKKPVQKDVPISTYTVIQIPVIKLKRDLIDRYSPESYIDEVPEVKQSTK
jgi:hypothetical protein